MDLAQKDDGGNLYVEIDDLRITYIKAENRAEEKSFSGQDVLQFKQFLVGSRVLCKMVDFPVDDKKMLTLAGEISLLWKAVKKST